MSLSISISNLNISGLSVTDFGSETGNLLLSSINERLNRPLVVEYTGSSGILESSFSGTGSLTGLVFGANNERQEFFIQNVSAALPTYVRLGAPASKQNFSFILNPSNATGWGGGSFSNDRWRGPVYFSGGAINGYQI